MKIPFNKPYLSGKELVYIRQAHMRGHLSGDGFFTDKCQKWLEKNIGCRKALLTHSCTAALEMAAILADIQPGDEVIMPSYAFVSAANAFVLRGGIPVFADIRSDTLNIDEEKIEAAITRKTKAIVVVHYAGVSCEMDRIMLIAKRHNLLVIEDAAHAILSKYKGRPLGNIGHLAALSFHETKNIISGEGGALLINDKRFLERAEIIREKGTDRSRFFRGEVDKYTWVDIGSSYLPSEILSAFLWAQMGEVKKISAVRLKLWNTYHNSFRDLESPQIRRPFVPPECAHNAHIYYLILKGQGARDAFISYLKKRGILSIFHYIPLHNSPAGRVYGRASANLTVTNELNRRIVRLPLWVGMRSHIQTVIKFSRQALNLLSRE